ncbi:hypothetical protein BKA65DRAFT_601806 [Rhexocercosporidium sp. MPI-PUGE-AT-0058]|nr:hypothetical protein BKA65DRAFT_601806 [Rhexocercosporidium sp. MPI-PUGE-AT-0058]
MEGFAIWGAITGSIGAINSVKGWVLELRGLLKEAREAGNTLQKFSVQYETCKADLEGWRDMYGLDENVTTRYQIELWGKRDREAIRGCLQLIYGTSEDIKGDAKWWGFNNVKNSAGSKRKAQIKEGSKKKTLEFVTSKSPDLLKKIDLIRSQTAEMKAIARSAFSRKHQKEFSGDFLSAAKLEEVKQTILFQLAYETRLGSKGLYHSCYAASRKTSTEKTPIKNIKLEMDLLRRGVVDSTTAATNESIALQYQLLVAWPEKLLEIMVEGPLSPEIQPSQYSSNDGDFYQACIKALGTKESGAFQVASIAGATWFRSYVPPEERRITRFKNDQNPFRNDNELRPLSTLLYELNTSIASEPADKFPRSERIKLAFKIVECGLFLSGTPWLTDLKSKQIQRSRRGIDYNRHFLLETSALKTDFDDSHFRDFAAHVFAIGILLTEIGTGRLVHEIPRRSKTLGQGLSLYAAQTDPPSNPIMFSDARINELLVEATMGDDYANAVKVCLESKESWRQVAGHAAGVRSDVYKKVLAEYYLEVYLPLKTLRGRIEWDMGEIATGADT